jgi:hypothetical protein
VHKKTGEKTEIFFGPKRWGINSKIITGLSLQRGIILLEWKVIFYTNRPLIKVITKYRTITSSPLSNPRY